MKKNTKKKPLIISAVGINRPGDIIERLVIAKIENGLPITMKELMETFENEHYNFIDMLFGTFNCLIKNVDGSIAQYTAEKINEQKKVGYWKNLWNAIRGKR